LLIKDNADEIFYEKDYEPNSIAAIKLLLRRTLVLYNSLLNYKTKQPAKISGCLRNSVRP
jgi:hypothetical protein